MSECFGCGSDEHLSYDCPNRTRQQAAPGTAPDYVRPSIQDALPAYNTGVPPVKDPSEIADYAARAAEARAMLRQALGLGSAEEDTSPLVDTPFRRRMGLPPRTEDELRAIARAQVAELRAAHA
jgi:hypothetical protein